MDKYEFNLKLEQFKKMVEKKDYVTAKRIADTIEWDKVRTNSILDTAVEVFEINNDFEMAREILLIQYERSSFGRSIAYKLGLVNAKLGRIREAEEYYQDFVAMAPSDSSRYILRYEIENAKQLPLNELIPYLESYIDEDMDDKWAYELATLYHKCGLAQECVNTCDTIILWFADGQYVKKAMELKMIYEPLSRSEEERYNELTTGGLLRRQEAMLYTPSEPELAVTAVSSDLQGTLDALDFVESEEVDDKESEEYQGLEEFEDEFEEEYQKLEEFEDKIEERYQGKAQEKYQDEDKEEIDINSIKIKQFDVNDKYNTINIQEAIAKSMASLLGDDEGEDELVNEPTKEIWFTKEFEKFKPRPHVEKIVIDQRPIDPMYELEGDGQIGMYVEEDKNTFADAYEGQLTIEEVLAAYEKRTQEEEVLKEAACSDEVVTDEAVTGEAVANEAVTEEIVADETISEQFSEVELDEEIEELLDDDKSIDDEITLDGNKEENLADEIIMGMQEIFAYTDVTRKEENEAIEEAVEDVYPEDDYFESIRKEFASMKQETLATDDLVSEEERQLLINGYITPKEENDSTEEVLEETKEEVSEEIKEDLPKEISSEEEIDDSIEEGVKTPEEPVEETEKNTIEETKEGNQSDERRVNLKEELKNFVTKYSDVTGLGKDIILKVEEVVKKQDKNGSSSQGNIIITGDIRSGKTTMAKEFLMLVNNIRHKGNRKIAKTNATILNKKGIAEAFRILEDTDIIIEKGTNLTAYSVGELVKCLSSYTGGMIVVIEDERAPIEQMLNLYPDFAKMFDVIINIKEFSVKEWVDYAKEYARNKGYEIEELASLALYANIDKLHFAEHIVTVESVEEMIDIAITNAQKGLLSAAIRLFKKKDTSLRLLKEEHFM